MEAKIEKRGRPREGEKVLTAAERSKRRIDRLREIKELAFTASNLWQMNQNAWAAAIIAGGGSADELQRFGAALLAVDDLVLKSRKTAWRP